MNNGERDKQPLLDNYQFSTDELRVLRECNTEAFLQRSLPLGTGLSLAAYFAIERGIIRPNPTYGAVPKIVLCAIVGYFIGKFSYQAKCAEKLMQLPNSRLAEVLRQRKKGGLVVSDKADVYSDEFLRNQQHSFDADFGSKSTVLDLDDIYRPLIDSSESERNVHIEQPEHGTTNDKIRNSNQRGYSKKEIPSKTIDEKYSITKAKSPFDEEPRTKPLSTNKYGDIWSD